jgi:hypothetical protein
VRFTSSLLTPVQRYIIQNGLVPNFDISFIVNHYIAAQKSTAVVLDVDVNNALCCRYGGSLDLGYEIPYVVEEPVETNLINLTVILHNTPLPFIRHAPSASRQ